MPTFICFSAAPDDYILVEEDPQQVAKELDHRSGLIEFRRLPAESERFEPTTAWVNPARVAFLSDARHLS
jgi:hypothetical protein